MNLFLYLSILIFICILLKLKYNNFNYDNTNYHENDEYNEYDKYDEYDDNKEIISYQLRNLYIENIVDEIYRPIYFDIIKTAINGKTSKNIKFMCTSKTNIRNNNCTNYYGYQKWLLHKYTQKFNIIKPEIIRNRIINKLYNAFPNSNITKYYKNCCEYYKITW